MGVIWRDAAKVSGVMVKSMLRARSGLRTSPCRQRVSNGWLVPSGVMPDLLDEAGVH